MARCPDADPKRKPQLAPVIARLRELDGKATPGPWVGDADDSGTCEVYSTNEGDGGHVAWTGKEPACQGRAIGDAELIAELRNALPALLSLADTLERERMEHSDAMASTLRDADRLREEVERLELKLAGHEQIGALIEKLWPQQGEYVVAEVLTTSRANQLPAELLEEAKRLVAGEPFLGWQAACNAFLRRIVALGEEK